MNGEAFLAIFAPPPTCERWHAKLGGELARAGLIVADRLPDRLVFRTAALPATHFGDGGILLGRLFASATPYPAASLERLTDQCRTPETISQVFEKFWGPSILMCGGRAQPHQLIRDPSGTLSAYWTSLADGVVFASESLLPLIDLLRPPEIDVRAIAHQLVYPDLNTAETGRAMVQELLPGCRWTQSRLGGQIDCLWRPLPHAAAQKQGSAAELGEGLAHTVRASIAALARGRGRILIELSGGLDSSCVTASAARAGGRISAVTLSTGTVEADEARYARMVASHLEIGLAEAVVDTQSQPVLASGLAARARPQPDPVVCAIDRAFASATRQIGADTLMTGAGGDNVFCYLTTASPVVDAMLAGRSPLAVLHTLSDASRMTGATLWSAARFTWRRYSTHRRRWTWPADTSLLNPDLIPKRPSEHPWLDETDVLPPGKREHVRALIRIQRFLDGVGRSWEWPMLHPLLSQPVMEACLSVPSWAWIEGGRDRALVRLAFAAELPEAITERRTKGRLVTLYRRCLADCRPALAQLLGEGWLRRSRLIDWAATETALGGDEEDSPFRLFALAGTELWARDLIRS